MKEQKKQLRKQIREKKSLHSDSTLTAWSDETLRRLEAHPAFCRAKVVVAYYSLPDEVCTHQFVERWARQKTILLPAIVGNELELRRYTGAHSLRTGAYGIPEPAGETFQAYHEIDLIIIPGVAFDRAGRRLGRGKGYYDRILPQLNAYKIGVCFPFQLVEEVPTEEFDARMDEIIQYNF
ncbi:5-formyltetrahydrofolate cyclo-ligase [Bacteroides sp. 214]|uniref:5-formyltetrahydrofolate cyclo-ligase n=1 Tax=Bacteroides sp. 214 TaxID=2302935 RepID=UPI0013D2C621|nr:5-formyltetrahydrofolate cyclo-ligase [Bacteroides sp. 214]NDW13718.1 5-formyltetrahydrofolate cyclo-ligase [Bacteroides sp. 214]